MRVFDGRVDVSALSMERPFGVAPSLSADLSLHGLDLEGLTGAFDFGSITGRLHGRIDGLRLVDWTATAFDAWLHTQPAPGVRQRISQRAVQDISSVGDASFVGSLQGRLVALFDDFGYRRIGIGCRLANEVCRMSGLHSAGAGFTIVECSGVPRLQVVGFHRNVDCPTLVERLAAAVAGYVAPVVDCPVAGPAATKREPTMPRLLGMPILIALVLCACVTINVYFPAAEAREAAREFVEKVIGEDGEAPPPGAVPPGDGGMASGNLRFDPLMLL